MPADPSLCPCCSLPPATCRCAEGDVPAVPRVLPDDGSLRLALETALATADYWRTIAGRRRQECDQLEARVWEAAGLLAEQQRVIEELRGW